jgi:hypothetical protein
MTMAWQPLPMGPFSKSPDAVRSEAHSLEDSCIQDDIGSDVPNGDTSAKRGSAIASFHRPPLVR